MSNWAYSRALHIHKKNKSHFAKLVQFNSLNVSVMCIGVPGT